MRMRFACTYRVSFFYERVSADVFGGLLPRLRTRRPECGASQTNGRYFMLLDVVKINGIQSRSRLSAWNQRCAKTFPDDEVHQGDIISCVNGIGPDPGLT